MERSTLYRRALAPTTTLTGCMGMAAAWLGWSMPITEGRPFCLLWMATSLCCLILAGLMVRRQAWVAEESFWSPPTRRVAMAMLPALCCGGGLGMLAVTQENLPEIFYWGLPPLWMLFYGCALFSAGFFMPRGIKLFGSLFVMTGLLLLSRAVLASVDGVLPSMAHAHIIMGCSFGFMHFAYGIYLFMTEKPQHSNHENRNLQSA